MRYQRVCCVFFFQAEDGIRDFHVTGVQTCALPISATLREVVERLDAPELASAWTDDTTLGWVYQYWNDPDREALDAKIAGGGKRSEERRVGKECRSRWSPDH